MAASLNFNASPDWQKNWKGMPEYLQRDLKPWQTINVHFSCPEERQQFADLIGNNLSDRTKDMWFPPKQNQVLVDKCFRSEVPQNPRFPIYVISKGRWESRMTAKALLRMNVPFRMAVEPQEFDKYAEVLDPSILLTLPFSNLGQGSIPARNWCWEHAISEGHLCHWILDDNIIDFRRMFNNMKLLVLCGNMFTAAEAFWDRYENIALSGFHYSWMRWHREVFPPYKLNSRIYSCILIRNDLPFRWRGRYNEDTDLSLRALKEGWCTVLFNAFLANKAKTMTMKGGNSDELYKGDGRHAMAKSLYEQHPDVTTITRRWGRWQHVVNYSQFERTRLKPKGSFQALHDVNNFGMYLSTNEDAPLLIVGEAPSRLGDPAAPLEGKIGKKLARLFGLDTEDYLAVTERMNVLEEWPGKDEKGDAFPLEDARELADKKKHLLMGRRVLFLGRRVEKAFGVVKSTALDWSWNAELKALTAVLPHPSGVVRWWNEEENVKMAETFLRNALPAAKRRSKKETE